MINPNQKDAEAMEKQLDELEKFITIKTAKEAAQSMTDEEKLTFLSNYYMAESLSFEEELNRRSEENVLILDKELEKGTKAPFSPALLEAMINLGKVSVMEELVDMSIEVSKTLREKLKGLKITDIKATLTYQLAVGKIAMHYNKLLAEELQNECKSRGIDFEAFMSEVYPAIVNDFSAFLEIDGYASLKEYENVKTNQLDISKIVEYSKKTIEYVSLILENKVLPQTIMIFPSLMNHFLFTEFQINNNQISAKVIELLKAENKKNYMDFFNQMLEEIWYVERGKGLIFMICRQQMEMMQEMMAGGMDPSMMGGMDPSMMGGMDPSMMGGMDPGMLGGMDPSMFGGQLPPGMTPQDMANMQGPPMGMPPFDPNSMAMPDMEAFQAMFENMDLSKLEEIMPQMKEMMEFVNSQNKK